MLGGCFIKTRVGSWWSVSTYHCPHLVDILIQWKNLEKISLCTNHFDSSSETWAFPSTCLMSLVLVMLHNSLLTRDIRLIFWKPPGRFSKTSWPLFCPLLLRLVWDMISSRTPEWVLFDVMTRLFFAICITRMGFEHVQSPVLEFSIVKASHLKKPKWLEYGEISFPATTDGFCFLSPLQAGDCKHRERGKKTDNKWGDNTKRNS